MHYSNWTIDPINELRWVYLAADGWLQIPRGRWLGAENVIDRGHTLGYEYRIGNIRESVAVHVG